jgi:hypothetical protein
MMGIEKALNAVGFCGRKLVSYLLNDPFGESCLVTGGYIANNTNNAEIAYPLILIGLYHTTRMTVNRIRLTAHIRKYGLTSRIIEKFSETSFCSNTVARAHAFGAKRYTEFKDIFRKYPAKYYLKKEIKNIAKRLESLV